ncbi:MAG: TIGR04255 family protein [Myxococcales bacterium]|nr:TIGR04255 family protein [Myxococcales bacterium]
MMKPRPSDLPDYQYPPVIEVVVGVQFEPMTWLRSAHVGKFWQLLDTRYVTTADVPRLPPRGEAGVRWSPLPRTHFVSDDDAWVVQLQDDRFLQNWRLTRDEDEYPHFEAIYAEFSRNLELWRSFCSDVGEGELAITHAEVSYVNHIPEGAGWHRLDEIGEVFADLAWRRESNRYLPAPNSVQWTAEFPLAEASGTLRIAIKHGRNRRSQDGVLLCELVAAGQLGELPLEQWLYEGRCAIVRGFTDLITEDVQREQFGRKT